MFGYVRPKVSELRVRDKLRYDAWYCGLCCCLGRDYGLAARICLSYDCTFLALTLSSANEFPVLAENRHCPFNPLGRKRPIIIAPSPAMDFAAAACILLANYKLDDDIHDGKKLRILAKFPLHSSVKKARKRYPELDKLIASKLGELSLIERAKTNSVDAPANAFGSLLSGLPSLAPINKRMQPVLAEMFFHLGRYIYLLDAWDDKEADEAKGLYNPFVLSGIDKTAAEFLLNLSINSCIDALNLFEANSDSEIVSNIIADGLFSTSDEILNKNKLSDKGVSSKL